MRLRYLVPLVSAALLQRCCVQPALPALARFDIEAPPFNKPTLFIGGERSNYIQPAHHAIIKQVPCPSGSVSIAHGLIWPAAIPARDDHHDSQRRPLGTR